MIKHARLLSVHFVRSAMLVMLCICERCEQKYSNGVQFAFWRASAEDSRKKKIQRKRYESGVVSTKQCFSLNAVFFFGQNIPLSCRGQCLVKRQRIRGSIRERQQNQELPNELLKSQIREILLGLVAGPGRAELGQACSATGRRTGRRTWPSILSLSWPAIVAELILRC